MTAVAIALVFFALACLAVYSAQRRRGVQRGVLWVLGFVLILPAVAILLWFLFTNGAVPRP